MNGNRYVDEILRRYDVVRGRGTPVYEVGQRLRGLIQRWYSERLVSVHNSGSFAKGTSIRGGADLDLFISLRPGTGRSLRRVYEDLYERVSGEGMNPRRQNVSIGVEVDNIKVDLVPGRKHARSNDHSLYLRRGDSWVKTNVARHISLVREAGKSPTIRATKAWRSNRGLKFPSFYLELAVLRALQHHPAGGTAAELQRVLEFLSTDLVDEEFVDPSNELNMISDDLTSAQRHSIANQAQASLRRIRDGQWTRVIW